jgi:hypothetical protein
MISQMIFKLQDCQIKSVTYLVAALLAVFVEIFIAGCSMSSIMINPDYKSKVLSGKHLRIAVVGPTNIDYEGNMDNEFSQENRYGKIRTFICSTAVKSIMETNMFTSVDMNVMGCKSFVSKKLDWNGHEDTVDFILRVPSDSCFSAPDSQGILLLLEQTYVKSHPFIQLIMINLIPVGGIPHKPLIIGGKFVYWDMAAKKPIAWGISSGTYDNGPGVTMDHWNNAAYDFSVKMVKDSPFDTASFRAKTKIK